MLRGSFIGRRNDALGPRSLGVARCRPWVYMVDLIGLLSQSAYARVGPPLFFQSLRTLEALVHAHHLLGVVLSRHLYATPRH